jgi:hypothetical protein
VGILGSADFIPGFLCELRLLCGGSLSSRGNPMFSAWPKAQRAILTQAAKGWSGEVDLDDVLVLHNVVKGGMLAIEAA